MALAERGESRLISRLRAELLAVCCHGNKRRRRRIRMEEQRRCNSKMTRSKEKERDIGESGESK